MPYNIAGIDVHKKMLAVVVADIEVEGEYQFERRRFGANPEQLQALCTLVDGAQGRRSGDGVHGSILEASMGRA